MSIKQTLEALKAKRRMREKVAAAYYPYLYKSAAQPPMDPSMMGGMPMDPSMMGGMPMDPSMMGGAPPMDPSMMGGMPPMDPSMMGGAPPMDPSMMGGMPMDPSMMGQPAPAPAAPAPAAPAAPAQGTPADAEQKVSNKIKTEQWMQHIDSYNYNLLKLMINLYEHLGIPVPAESLLPQPLGSDSPSAGDISGMMGMAADATAPQTPIDAMAEGDVVPPDSGNSAGMMQGGMDQQQAAPPPMEGGDIKQSSWNMYDPYTGLMNYSWRAPRHKQAGVRPYSGNVKKANFFSYPAGYRDVLNKINKFNYGN